MYERRDKAIPRVALVLRNDSKNESQARVFRRLMSLMHVVDPEQARS